MSEVLYFTRISQAVDDIKDVGEANDAWRFLNLALICLFSLPDQALLELSHHIVPPCIQLDSIHAIPVQDMISIIAMVPHKHQTDSGVEDCFFMVEKPGLDLTHFTGVTKAGKDEDDEGNAGNVE